MTILNYFFVGVVFTFMVDLLLNIDKIKTHPKMKSKIWGGKERILCILIWPLSILTFLIAFIKQLFKK